MEFTRPELKLILEGLDVIRELMREEIGPEGSATEEYNRLVRLQDRVIEALESRSY